MASELCMNCFSVKGQYEVCPYCGYIEGTPPVQPHCLTPGTILGNHFIVGTVIGFGGFGITYKCYDTTLGITVAAKEFYPMGLVNRSPGQSKVGLLSGDKRTQYMEQLKRFLMEAQSVAQFGKAKDIVNIYDYFEENGTAYIIMEYIDGILLKNYLEKQGAMPPDVAISVIMPIIEAVKKIHSKGIIHRDISPDNIFITDESNIKIFDFGAAQLNNSKEGMAGEKVIKVGYSAPEQYRDKNRQGFYTDIYSVGAILYQMLTGRKPIESTEREYKDKLRSPMELGVRVNSNVDRAVMEALAVRPEFRYQGIQQFEDALRNKRAAEYPKDKLRKKKRKRNWIIGAAATLVLAMGVTIGLTKTVLRPKNQIFESAITADVNEITIWVENGDQKHQLEDVIENGFHKGNISLGGDNDVQQWEKFWKENDKVQNVKVEVVPDISEALRNTSEDQLPDMYLTDHVPTEQKKDLISLEDVYRGLNIEEYAYLNEETYAREFPTYKELPTGLDTLLLYVCELDDNENNTLNTTSSVLSSDLVQSDKKVEANVVQINDLVDMFKDVQTAEGGQNRTDVLAFEEDTITGSLLLEDETAWDSLFEKENNGGIPDCTPLIDINDCNKKAHQSKYRLNSDPNTDNEAEDNLSDAGSADTPAEVYGNHVVAGVAFRKTLHDIENSVGVRNSISSNKYQTYVIRNSKNEMLVIYSERFGIRNSSDSNKMTACKRILYLMMQSGAQSQKDNSNVATTFPIRIDQLEDFTDTHGKIKDFVALYSGGCSCIVVSDITGNMHEFSEGLGDRTDSREIKEYCLEYVRSDSETDSEDMEHAVEETSENGEESDSDNTAPYEGSTNTHEE